MNERANVPADVLGICIAKIYQGICDRDGKSTTANMPIRAAFCNIIILITPRKNFQEKSTFKPFQKKRTIYGIINIIAMLP